MNPKASIVCVLTGLLVAFVLAVPVSASSERLPHTVAPVNYQLTVEPDLKEFKFKGQETITINVLKSVNKIILNAVELKISNAAVQAIPGTTRVAGKVTFKEKLEQATINFAPAILSPGRYKLSCQFSGVLNDKMRGFYRAAYTDSHRTKQYLAATFMEPTNARRMFPCFDEPEYKTTYQINTIIAPDLVAISNAPVVQSAVKDAKKIVVFETTPKMSSYLVALVVGDMHSTGTKVACGIPISVWAVAGKEHLGKYALDVAAKLLPYYTEYFGMPYLGKKLDLIAIPEAEGGMENVGAIIFTDEALLNDEKTGTKSARQGIAGIVAHEMAHQWFGNLVTAKWWDDIWLNEAFATFMTTKATNYLHPEWKVWRDVAYERYNALYTDSLQSTRSIQAHVVDASQAMQIFDEITYQKGASVLRMLEQYLGDAVFRKGIQRYMRSYAFANATTEQLWRVLERESKSPVVKMMKPWVYQLGYPLISGKLSAGGRQLTLQQGRFFLDPPGKIDSGKWLVPVMVRYISVNQPVIRLLLSNRQQSFAINRSSDPLVVNAGAKGFFRVQYNADDLKRLESVMESRLSALERSALLSDVSALAVAEKISVADELNFLLALKDDKEPFVLSQLVASIFRLEYFIDDRTRPYYEQFTRKIVLPIKARLTWQELSGESDDVRNVRNSTLCLLGTYGQDKSTIAEAFDLYGKYKNNPDAVSPEMVGTILSIVAYNGGEKEYLEVKDAWKKAKTPEEEDRYLSVLTEFRSPELVKKTLQLSLDPEVKANYRQGILSMLLNQEHSKQMAWSFTKEHWSEILKTFIPWNLAQLPRSCGSFHTGAEEQDVRSFFAAHPVPNSQTALSRTLESIHINVLYHERATQPIRKWLTEHAS